MATLPTVPKRQNLFKQLAASLELDCRRDEKASTPVVLRSQEKFMGDAVVVDADRHAARKQLLISNPKK